ncbi:MAG: tetratricopeptide repeat protein [Candidatus Obscuribacterales bacterium]|nr:tetratricopeptide repeat protein [Candidatus Obscuribacterales bacterium]
MKTNLTAIAATLLLFRFVHASTAMAAAPPDLHDPAVRQVYIKSCSDRIRNAPNDSEAYAYRGYVYLHDDKLQESLADLNKANELEPNNLKVLCTLGEVHIALKDYKSATSDFSAAIALKPQEAAYYANRGVAYMFSNQLAEAQKDALKALQLDPQFSPAFELMGETSYKSNKYAECIKYCNEAIKRSSGDADAFYFRGCAYEKLGNKTQADLDKAKATRMGYHGQVLFHEGSR